MADTPPNPWPGFQHDPANTGQAPVAVATPGAELTVVFKAPQEITAGIAIGADGSLLFACADNNLYAVSPTGDLRWTAPLSYQTRTYNAVPAVTPEGLIYAGGLRVYCFDGGGTKQWQFPVSSNFTVTAPLTLGSDGTLYVVGTAAPGVAGVPTQLIALAPNGTQRWAATLDGTVYAAPALGPGGAVYVGTKSGTLY
ncbi:MAG TPA: PQQ-binding-like beta-propeller repeat protein, partial [Rhodothermales bacterium]|nr:PQQ-binding-like beta-propeller repeat protein [Rhodothermales bacterium]